MRGKNLKLIARTRVYEQREPHTKPRRRNDDPRHRRHIRIDERKLLTQNWRDKEIRGPAKLPETRNPSHELSNITNSPLRRQSGGGSPKKGLESEEREFIVTRDRPQREVSPTHTIEEPTQHGSPHLVVRNPDPPEYNDNYACSKCFRGMPKLDNTKAGLRYWFSTVRGSMFPPSSKFHPPAGWSLWPGPATRGGPSLM